MKKIYKYIKIIAIISAIIYKPIYDLIQSMPTYDKGTVISYKDGDTYIIEIEGIFWNSIKEVRLIGIDVVEVHIMHGGIEYDILDYDGLKAAAYIMNIMPKGSKVILEYDVEKYDKYGRTLAYIWLDDGELLNNMIHKYVPIDYYRSMWIEPNTRHR